MGVNDDWSYIRSAFHLAQTGHISYFGWDEPILGWQLYWSLPFLHFFGLSFSAARFSGLLIACACVYLTHRILVRSGVSVFNATVGTLTFALSPLFLPISFSFMSDVAGLFALLLCLDLCLRSLQSSTPRAASAWLFLALAANLVLGTARQVSWLGALLIVPAAYWLLHHRRPALWKALTVWIFGLVCLYACVKWFQHQPFTQSDNPLDDVHNRQSSSEIIVNFLHFGLSLPLFLLPVLIGFITPAWLQTNRSKRIAGFGALVLAASTGAAVFLNQRRSLADWFAPFTKNYVTAQGFISIPDIGVRPTQLSYGVRAGITWLVVAACIAIATCILAREPSDHLPVPGAGVESLTSRNLWLLIAPFTLVYCCLLAPRGLVGSIFDRYLLPLLVVALIAALLLYQRYVADRLPAISLIFLLITAAYSVAAMHDVYAIERARLTAANELQQAGVPRTAFYGGFEYDGWTQIDSWGYVQSLHLNLPPALAHDPSDANTNKGCGYIFYKLFAAIKPAYAISFDPLSCQGPSHFAPVPYRTWLPPYKGSLYIQQVAPEATQAAEPASPQLRRADPDKK